SDVEKRGFLLPVLKVECDYKKSATFDDPVAIYTKIAEYSPIKLTFAYEARKISEADFNTTHNQSLTNPSGNLSHQVLQNICGSTQISNQPGFNDQRLIYIKLSKRLGRKSKRTIVHTIQQTFEQSDNRG